MNKFFKMLGVVRVEEDSLKFKWGYIAKGLSFQFVVNRGGYFDSRYAISVGFIFGYIHIYLPFRTRLSEGCDLPRYGFAIHNNTFWIYIGGEYDESIGQVQGKSWITWGIPFFTWKFDNHWIMNKEGNYQIPHKIKTPMKDGSFRMEMDYKYDFALRETYPYVYTLKSGEVQERTATIYQEKRQWHRKWFPFIKMTRECIDIKFNDEVGEKTGSWKGGVMGTSCEINKGESMLDCLRRFEKERKF